MNFIERINSALEPYSMRNHAGMQKVLQEGMSLQMAQRIAREYGPCNAASLRIMASALSVIEDLDFSHAMVENMYDEIGGPNRADSHILMFEKFMTAVMVDPSLKIIKNSNSERVIQTFLAVKDEKTEHQALALMHGFEAVFPYICGAVYQSLMKSQLVSEEAAFFFIHHAEADVYHSDRMLQVLNTKADTLEKQKECLERSVFGAQVIHKMFDEILTD